MSLPTRSARRLLAVLTIGVLGAVLAACSGGNDGEGAPPSSPTSGTGQAAGQLSPVIVTSELAVGPNRFAVGVIDQSRNKEVLGAKLHFRFFKVTGSNQATLKFESSATPVWITRSYTETHDGKVETHEAGETGVYVANVQFDEPGQWGVEISGSVDGQTIEPLLPGFEVKERSSTPAIGAAAPPSRQLTLSDVGGDISKIDTSDPPDPEMHRMTIADAVASGRPTVIAFATPAFCETRICGPTKQVVDDLAGKYGGRANFIHVEPYDLEKARNGRLEPISLLVQEWGMSSEPWVVVVDTKGNVAAKFEAVVAIEEIETALRPLVQ